MRTLYFHVIYILYTVCIYVPIVEFLSSSFVLFSIFSKFHYFFLFVCLPEFESMTSRDIVTRYDDALAELIKKTVINYSAHFQIKSNILDTKYLSSLKHEIVGHH